MLSDEIVASVAVVGGGPAGLVAAATLAQYGVDVVLLEKRLHGSALPRASVASVRTMELMRRLGVADDVLAGADPVDFTLLRMSTVAEAAHGEVVEVGYPSLAEAAMLSPVAAAAVAQDHLEAVLFEHLKTLRTARVIRGVEVTEVLDDGASGRGVRLLGTVEDRRVTISAEYAVAADGAWSRTRHSLGVDMLGPDALFRLVQAEIRSPLWDVLGQHRHLVYSITHPDAGGVLVPAGQGDRWIYIVVVDDTEPEPDASAIARRFRIAAGVPDLPVRVERLNRAAPGAQLARRFSSGRVYLTGDAAHRVTPRGGTGLNTAIGSARNLAWKLAWVLRGWAEPGLLDSYEAERRPIAEHNVRRSADADATRAGVLGETLVDLGGRMRHQWLRTSAADEPLRSTLDCLGDGVTLFVGHEGADWADVVDRWSRNHELPVTPVALDAAAAIALGLGPAGALLVGPDGVPLGQWTSAAAADFGAVMPRVVQSVSPQREERAA